MFAPPKFVFLVLLLIAVWYLLKWVNRPARPNRSYAARRARPAGPTTRPQARIEAEDLVACGVCGAYVALTASGCGKPGCPRPR